MRRNLDSFAATGKEILSRHRHYDLQASEICELIDRFGAVEHGDIFYKALTYGFSAGVKTGYNIAQADQRKKVTYLYNENTTINR